MTQYEEYLNKREELIREEENMWVGATITLSEKEQQVNKILMKYKYAELADGFKHPERFPPAMHFFKAKPLIEKSEVFKILRDLPKGASLHSHDTAMASSDYVMSLMNTADLYGCIVDGRLKLKVIKSRSEPKSTWKPLSELRHKQPNFDNFLLKQISLYDEEPEKAHQDVNTVWNKFINCFMTVNGVVCYKAVFAQYFYQALQELYDDNVRYLEFRGLLPEVYDDDNNVLAPLEVLQIYHDTWVQFKKDHNDFRGCKFIYAPIRFCDKEMVRQYIKTAVLLQEHFPDFVAGFDLVGQEDLGQPLREFSQELFKLSKRMNLFFHAGETNWNSFDCDTNLVDALLFNTKRIGHGFGIVRHPVLMKTLLGQESVIYPFLVDITTIYQEYHAEAEELEVIVPEPQQMACEKEIAVEICPISNQVLQLVSDARNHPGCVLLNSGCPVVIANDDPGMWLSKGLSYDWYIAFMGMAARNADLRLLKQLAQNSIMYSSMSSVHKHETLSSWAVDWNDFLNVILKRYK